MDYYNDHHHCWRSYCTIKLGHSVNYKLYQIQTTIRVARLFFRGGNMLLYSQQRTSYVFPAYSWKRLAAAFYGDARHPAKVFFFFFYRKLVYGKVTFLVEDFSRVSLVHINIIFVMPAFEVLPTTVLSVARHVKVGCFNRLLPCTSSSTTFLWW